ncbi:hypothetical protein Syun_030010 [Stephania yunnanensis]|uniref:Uncharacterized protein n=1 Tax=Stephania yunnanensis TaxID=152371 RepID=A0AAP0HKD8_9MAGN
MYKMYSYKHANQTISMDTLLERRRRVEEGIENLNSTTLEDRTNQKIKLRDLGDRSLGIGELVGSDFRSQRKLERGLR